MPLRKPAKITERTPPAIVPKSKQYDLFTEFFGDRQQLSNTIELWDAIPKYAVSARRQVSLRDENGRLPVHEYGFEYGGRACRLEVQPASIKIDGHYQDFYPSADEELIEEVIRKIFADQAHGIHVVEATESWVKFSLYMIRKELEARGKTRSIDEIKTSLRILISTIIRVSVDVDGGQELYAASILGDMVRQKTDDEASGMWAVRLPSLISKSINELTYRQFNYGTLMTLSGQLVRYLHKRLSHQYTNASITQDYTVLYSTLRADSGLLEANRITKNIDALDAALDELQERGVLYGWKKQERREGRNKLADVVYTLTASMDFAKEVRAANGRLKEARNGRTPSGGLLFHK